MIYLHSQAMIHGDLKGVWFQILVIVPPLNLLLIKANILIDQTGHACLADFGLLTIISDSTNFTASSFIAIGGTTRWMSPELLDPDQANVKDGKPTKASDCYALGMVIYEVLSEQVPFAQFRDFIVIQKVMKGERPGRPEGVKGGWFMDSTWDMLGLCWAPQPESRPSVEAVLELLEQVPRAWIPTYLQMEEAAKVNKDTFDFAAVSDSSLVLISIPFDSHPH